MEPMTRATDKEKEKPAQWAHVRGVRVYNYALLDDVTDSQFEERIGRAIQTAYADGYDRGFRRGAETLEERLGA